MSLAIDTTPALRPNEHLAVFLPRHLWKPDALASHCDNFYCRVAFSLFERRHHCRKCGGVFCQPCTSRSTPLLDTTNLDFLLPPRNVPISTYDSLTSPVLDARVCDDCYDQIYGQPSTPRTPQRPDFKRALSHPINLLRYPLSPNPSTASSSASNSDDEQSVASSSSLNHLPAALSRKSRSIRTSPSFSSLNSASSRQPQSSSQPCTRRSSLRNSHKPLSVNLDLVERSYGELDAYPLRRSSVLCKATGGGRWEPKHETVLVGYRPPGGKAPFEIEMEREEEEERLRRLNPIRGEGEFQYRFPPKDIPEEDDWTSRGGPYILSTF
ncbi:FYVE-domain-containing protein [Macrolepiota fuliginosa MF-IS2]|uniref:FYVE-domain-containing protein n=1 Tax=Macrolepiota fuliginosa MF-IS2 TaxID=1400762 RepID=A0A9P5XEH4_9AGAR|nr:FYVE-domain-containing protein [Macrolepiota fuliginosa MF-IS2]